MDQIKNRIGHVKEDISKALAAEPKFPVQPVRVDSIPKPRPPAQLPTSDEIHLSKQARRQQEIQQSDQLVDHSLGRVKDSQLPPQERAKELWGVVRGLTGKALTTAVVGTSRVIHDTSASIDQKSFNDEFGPLVGPSSQYLSTFSCSVANATKNSKVTIHICTTHLCMDGNGVKDLIPLHDVAALIPSVAMPVRDSSIPYFIAVPDPRVKANAIQVFTAHKSVYQLSGISQSVRHLATHPSGNPVGLLFAEMDRAWRAASVVPNPNVDFN